MTSSHREHDEVDRWLASRHRAFIADLAGILDAETGLHEATIPAQHRRLATGLAEALDLNAGLAAIGLPEAAAAEGHTTAVILTAIDVEYQAVRQYLNDIEDYTHPAGTRFEMGAIAGTESRVALAVTGQGSPAAIIAEQAITLFEPSALLFVGVAGSLQDSVSLGDVVVGERVYAFQGGHDELVGFKHRPKVLEAPLHLVQFARHVARDGTWMTRLLHSPQSSVPAVHVAPIASTGVALDSRTSLLAQQLAKSYADAAVVEMESAGLASAGPMNRVAAITVRGISDYADGRKVVTDDDRWQVEAARRAAAFAISLVCELPTAVSDPAERATELGVLRAIRQYATTNDGLGLAAPWLRHSGLRTDPTIRAQFLDALRQPDDADVELIGRKWRAALADPPLDRDFTREALTLVGYFLDHAQQLEPLQRLRQEHRLNRTERQTQRIGDAVEADAGLHKHVHDQLAAVRLDLAGVNELLDAGVGTNPTPSALQAYRHDQTALLVEKTRGFVGRRFVFERLASVFDGANRGYCSVMAPPGVGKTALLAQLVKNNRYIHHFNVTTGGATSPTVFLRNTCAQLITMYGLPITTLPPHVDRDDAFLVELLGMAVAAANGSRVIVAVDALDEADSSQLPPGTNPMYLPELLPRGCFIVLTTRSSDPDRPDWPRRLHTSCEQFTVPIDPHGAENMADVREYIGQRVGWPGIQAYRHRHGLDRQGFVEHLAMKSEGNFMYLRHVLPEIERGTMNDRDLADIPAGLEQYYADQLERMRGSDPAGWFEYRLPVVAALSFLPGPLSVDQIAGITGIRSLPRIQDVLRSWAPFLRRSVVIEGGHSHQAYTIYHASYQDFLRRYVVEVEDAVILRITERLDDSEG